MASYNLYSHSPPVPGPVTPIHSPHHSVHSSTSLRTPLYTLSIHEYRKQQSTPLSRIATPSGRTLRRKASAFALNEIEHMPSTRPVLHHDPYSSPRPLHASYSAHQLAPGNPFLGVRPLPDQISRSQSAEPRAFGDSITSVATLGLQGKVRHFNTRKRLPRPLEPTSSGLQPPLDAPVRPTRQIRATLPAPLSFLTEESNLSDARSTPTPSLSQFPRPPHFESLREVQREKAISFATTAPATPPATPATIHYRGASFDLVNPHTSLPYHDIVTPTIDSSELLQLRLSQEYQSSLSDMAPKRPLYGDLDAAHAGIVRRAEDAYALSMLDLPLPPTPAALSPGSSNYTSPVYSPESHFAPSPLAVRKVPDESRFSIKQLARTLTKRLTKSLEHDEEAELQQFQGLKTGALSIETDTEPLRPLEHTHMPTRKSSYFPISPVSPTSPNSLASLNDLGSASDEEESGFEHARRDYEHNYCSNDLTSMLPSSQFGRADESHGSMPAPESGVRPYYDDLASIYASSSIYTGDDRRKSTNQQSLVGNRQSIAFQRYSGLDAAEMADEYSYNDSRKISRPSSKPLIQDCSIARGDRTTDTISKLIDHYDLGNTGATSSISQNADDANTTGLAACYTNNHGEQTSTSTPQIVAPVSHFSHFQFDLESAYQPDTADEPEQVQPALNTKRARKYSVGAPPSVPPPLAPAFHYGQGSKPLSRPKFSGMSSNGSYNSYGDTRDVLQLPQSESGGPIKSLHKIPCSSSYSQSDTKAPELSSSHSQPEYFASTNTPQEALDHAELIFHEATGGMEPSYDDIPAMWGRRSPVNLPRRSIRLREESPPGWENEKADWETVAGDSQQGRTSLDSIADYSSSDGNRDSLGLTAAISLRSRTEQDQTYGPSIYSHPSPIRAHTHPFSSSPPQLATHTGSQTAPVVTDMGTSSSPPSSSTVPAFGLSNSPGCEAVERHAFSPWADPYALSDKETQELLASGPNDDILIDKNFDSQSRRLSYRFKNHAQQVKGSSLHSVSYESGLERENTFDKFTMLGPKGNLTGTPKGSGMHDAGSSVANTSSPGAKLSSSSPRSDYYGFYASPFPATGSVTRIREPSSVIEHQHERMPSQITLFPGAYTMEPVQCSSPLAGADSPEGLRCSTTFKPARRTSRAAVPGQTRLRQMVLAPDARSTASSKATRFSRFMGAGGSGRPSTSDTATPLYPTHPSLDTFPTIRSGSIVLAHQHSPHLLCPERKVNDEDEVRRRKLSWLIFACFCILPPCMFLYRTWGDSIIVSVTKGDLGHCTAKSKRAALIAGAVVNIGLVTAILVPILVAQALQAI
ncbi:hypothetical protein OPT61_g3431 [Boeremia exigua]|uniref:Uncharacterized protein n=1 Tax=Boeremia exigua TaxID=749465 RepID=A0ACC2IHW8_9PLEO|nr:hypothetical protein OPT61_g3431 [Boeremia exigua]